MRTFSERLSIKLSINDIHIPCGNIKYFEIDAFSYGFKSLINFSLSSEIKEDQIYSLFISSKPLKIKIETSSHYLPEKKIADPLILQGYVTEKKLLNECIINNIKGKQVQFRTYQIQVSDTAQVIWKQHFPTTIKTNLTIKDFLKNLSTDLVNLEINHPDFDKENPLLSVNLGNNLNKASFYDFILWICDKYHAYFLYDGKRNTYTISNQYPDNEPTQPHAEEIETIQTEFYSPPFFNTSILNGYALQPDTQECKNQEGFSSLKKETLINTTISSLTSNENEKAQYELIPKLPKTTLVFKTYPTNTISPLQKITFKDKDWEKTRWSAQQNFFISSLHIQGKAERQEATEDDLMQTNGYSLNVSLELVNIKEKKILSSNFTPPPYPFNIEGLVVSEKGEEKEETYQIYTNESTSLDTYKVKIPLWENQEVYAPFTPHQYSGHMYFPLYKDARVLLSCDFKSISIAQSLEWKTTARLPQDSQGNQILFGWTSENKSSITHTYNENNPELQVIRTSKKDGEVITLKEGALILETKESED
jgi:hypothetical protein